jgi:hypothetical protein
VTAQAQQATHCLQFAGDATGKTSQLGCVASGQVLLHKFCAVVASAGHESIVDAQLGLGFTLKPCAYSNCCCTLNTINMRCWLHLIHVAGLQLGSSCTCLASIWASDCSSIGPNVAALLDHCFASMFDCMWRSWPMLLASTWGKLAMSRHTSAVAQCQGLQGWL